MINLDYDQLKKESVKHYQNYIKNLAIIQRELVKFDIIPFATRYNENLHDVYCVDGSYVNFWRAPLSNIRISGVRIGSVIQKYQPNSEIGYNEDCKAPITEIFDMDLNDSKISSKEILEYVMGLRERQQLYKMASQSENQMIMVDGSLLEPYHNKTRPEFVKDAINVLGEQKFEEINRNSSMESLIDICNKNKHILVGVAKDSELFAIKNMMQYEVALEKALELKKMQPNATYYFKTPSSAFSHSSNPDNSPFGSIFAKLHSKAVKWHRIDYLKSEHHDLETDILPTLANASLYIRYFGSPRAPQVCDSIAVEIRQRKNKVFQDICQILKEVGFSSNDILYGETDMNGEKTILHRSAHDLFDMNRVASRDKTNL